MKITVEDVVAEFNRPITVNEHGCWLWNGCTDKNGYARYCGALVHPIVCRRAGKNCVGDQELCHQCPNKNCINPDHYYVGTHKQNMNDDYRKPMGRKGKLNQHQIDELNLMLAKGIPKSAIAYHFGVSPQWISKFLKGDFTYAKPC